MPGPRLVIVTQGETVPIKLDKRPRIKGFSVMDMLNLLPKRSLLSPSSVASTSTTSTSSSSNSNSNSPLSVGSPVFKSCLKRNDDASATAAATKLKNKRGRKRRVRFGSSDTIEVQFEDYCKETLWWSTKELQIRKAEDLRAARLDETGKKYLLECKRAATFLRNEIVPQLEYARHSFSTLVFEESDEEELFTENELQSLLTSDFIKGLEHGLRGVETLAATAPPGGISKVAEVVHSIASYSRSIRSAPKNSSRKAKQDLAVAFMAQELTITDRYLARVLALGDQTIIKRGQQHDSSQAQVPIVQHVDNNKENNTNASGGETSCEATSTTSLTNLELEENIKNNTGASGDSSSEAIPTTSTANLEHEENNNNNNSDSSSEAIPATEVGDSCKGESGDAIIAASTIQGEITVSA